MPARPPRFALALALCVVSCGPTDRVVGRVVRDAAVDLVATPPDGAPPDARVDAGACAAMARCRAALVATAFRYALCVCNDQTLSGTFVTDSFDSARGPYVAPGGLAGAVGINGALVLNGDLDVGGALLVGGEGGVTAGARLRVRGALRSQGPVQGAGEVTLADGFVRGDVRVAALRVSGTLTLPPGRAATGERVREVANLATAEVSVAPPCDCAAAQRLPVRALVDARRDDNDDAAAGLTADGLAGADAPSRVTLPCGRYYFRGVRGGDRGLTLSIAGPAALYVDGDLDATGDLRVELLPGAEVDLFVTGNVHLSRALAFGDPAAPSRARMFLGGGGVLQFAGDGAFGGNLYAPEAELQASGAVSFFGAALVGRVSASGNVAMHFDTAVLDPAASCASVACATCRDCPQRACVDGACGPCRRDDDCCAPLRCAAGRCIPEPP